MFLYCFSAKTSAQALGLPGVSNETMNDALSDIFKLIKLKSCVYFQRDFHGPWAMRIEGTGHAHFHVITRGNCVVEVNGHAHRCSVGDVIFFPRSTSHVLADRPGRQAVPGPEVMGSFEGNAPYFSKGEEVVRIICGHYEYKAGIPHPLIAELPDFVHIRSLDILPDARISSILPLLMAELSNSEAGSSSIIERYAEILLIQILRTFAAQKPQQHEFLNALCDQRLIRAINRIHRDYAQPIGLDDLAHEAALSRSAFAQRFKDTAGIAPIEYLAKWRMITASEILKTTDLPISHVCEKVGYESDISFARAFKREFGVTPSQHRRRA